MRTLFLVLLVVLVSVSWAAAQDDVPEFTLADPEPVVTHSEDRAAWDGRYTDPGAVFYHDGQFHMFRNGFQGWPASVEIGYLTSPDGITWTEASEDPVLYTADVPFADVAALASSALVLDDGTWVLYFYTWNSSTPGQAARSVIGRATATDPLGPWTVDPEPVLDRGEAGTWDSNSVSAPSVLRDDDGFVMHYAGSGETGQSAIGRATSTDGITWTRDAEPVFVSPDDERFVHQPRVERGENGYILIYRTMGSPAMGLGIATSADGVTWTNQTAEPFWTREDMPRGTQGFWFTALAYHDGTLYLYIEGGRGRGTDIWVATAAWEG